MTEDDRSRNGPRPPWPGYEQLAGLSLEERVAAVGRLAWAAERKADLMAGAAERLTTELGTHRRELDASAIFFRNLSADVKLLRGDVLGLRRDLRAIPGLAEKLESLAERVDDVEEKTDGMGRRVPTDSDRVRELQAEHDRAEELAELRAYKAARVADEAKAAAAAAELEQTMKKERIGFWWKVAFFVVAGVLGTIGGAIVWAAKVAENAALHHQLEQLRQEHHQEHAP